MKYSLYISVLIAIMTSCASTQQYVQLPKTDNAINNEAIIYILRPATVGAAIKFKIYQNDRSIGELGPQSYLAWSVNTNSDQLKITSVSENSDHLTFQPMAGEVYYIHQKVKMGVVIARTKLEFLSQEEGENILKKLKKPEVKITQQLESDIIAARDEVIYLKNGSEIHGTIIKLIPDESVKIKTAINNVFVHNQIEIKKIEIDSLINKTVYLKNGSIIHGKIIEFELGETIKIKTSNDNVFVYKMDEVKEITIYTE